jgi:predicted permease
LSSPGTPFSYGTQSVREIVVGKHRPLLNILTGCILFVFLLACSNVSNLILARYTRRRAEFAIRIALGAEIPDLLVPLLAESGLICSSGFAIGLVLSGWIRALVQRMVPVAIPRLDQAALNSQTLLFAAGLTLLAILLVSVLPVLEIFRQTPHDLIKGARSGKQPRSQAGFSRRAVLLVVNSALAMVLLVGSVLMLQSLTRLLAIDVGFSPKQLFTAEVSLSSAKYSTDQKEVAGFQEMLRSVASIGGLRHAAIADAVPFGGTLMRVEIEAKTAAGEPRQRFVNVNVASSGLPGVYGIPFLAGRDFAATDSIGHPRVALVSQLAAKMLWPNESAIGKRFQGGWGSTGELTEVVGVVGDMRSTKLQTPSEPTVYLPYTQVPRSTMFIVARSGMPASALASAVSEAVRRVDRDQPIENVRNGDDLLSKSLREPKFVGGLLVGFSLLALLLSAIGVYGVVSYWVSQSTREIGVRIALGAQRGAVVGMMMGRTFRIVAGGLAAGLLISLAVVQILSSVLYEVEPRNPVALLLGAATVAAVTLIAAAAPAVRAATVDPIRALRYD